MFCRLVFLSLILLAFVSSAIAQDIVKVAPNNVKVLLDNSEVRVMKFTMKKGEKIGLHSHPPYVVYSLTEGKVHFTMPDKTTRDMDLKPGQAVWSDGGAHVQESLMDTEAIVIELKKAKPIGPGRQAGKK